MSFMQIELAYGEYYEIETPDGTWFLPCDVHPGATDPAELRDYVESLSDPSDWSLTVREGFLGRYSAPGYLDCTDWIPGDDEASLVAELRERYGDDAESDDGDAPGDDTDRVRAFEVRIRERFGLEIVDANSDGVALLGSDDAVNAFLRAIGAYAQPNGSEWVPVVMPDGADGGQIDPAPGKPAHCIYSAISAALLPVLVATFDPPDVPNLDCMESDELREWGESIARTTHPCAGLLYRYALAKSDAIGARLKGRIPQAGRLEAECDAIYRQLPLEYRW